MPRGDRLFDLLAGCSDRQLESVWTLDLRKKPTANEFDKASASERHLLVSAELRSAAGHTVGNIRRGPHDLEWGEIVDLALTGLATVVGEDAASVERTKANEDVRAREVALLTLAETRVRTYLQSKGVDPETVPQSPADLASRVQLEDEALRSSAPPLIQFDPKAPRKGIKGRILNPANLLLGKLAPLGPLGIALEPSYTKVIPAVVRLLQVNNVAAHTETIP